MSKLYAEEQSIQTHYGKEPDSAGWPDGGIGYPAEEDGQPVVVVDTPIVAFS